MSRCSPAVLVYVFGFLTGACSGAAAQPRATPDPPAPQGTSLPPASRPEAAQSAAPGSVPTRAVGRVPEETKPAELEPAACPAEMVLVDGEYCTDAEQDCLQWWWDESNKKKVCEVFDPPSRCVGSRVKKRFCIDRFSWPNQEGARPEVMNRWHEAQVKCAAIGKRMCTESEWTLACEGPDIKPFPYGYVRDPRKCNGDHPWDGPKMTLVAQRDPDELARLWKGVRSGSQPYCVSDFGVPDLPGNNDEVVASEHFKDPGFKGKFDSIHSGGPWYKGVRNQCRPKIYTHDEGFYYYFLGFRCCAEPDGRATDPRTPRQRDQGWEFQKVERLAGVTREEVRQHLELKKRQGHCSCDQIAERPRRTRCHTICGTLLGPNAQDAKQPPVVGPPPHGAQKKVPADVLQRALAAGDESRSEKAEEYLRERLGK